MVVQQGTRLECGAAGFSSGNFLGNFLLLLEGKLIVLDDDENRFLLLDLPGQNGLGQTVLEVAFDGPPQE